MTIVRRLAPIAALMLVAITCAGCAIDHVAFRPRENVDAESPQGHAAATYTVAGDDVEGSAEVRLWSPGVDRLDTGEVMVRIGFEIENRFASPIVLAAEAAEVVDLEFRNGVPPAKLRDPLIAGSREVAAGAVSTIDLMFELPGGVEPVEVRSFALSWGVREPVRFDQHTAFRRVPRPVQDYPYYYETNFPFYYYRRGGLYGRFGGFGVYCW